MTESRRPGLIELAGVATIVAAISLACWQWKTIFADFGLIVPTAASAVLAAIVSLTIARFERPRPVSFVVLVVVLTLGLAAIYRSSIVDLPSDLITSRKALVSTGLLIPTSARFVIVPVVVAALGTWLAVDLFVRKAAAVPAVLVILTVHGIATAYTIGQQSPALWLVGIVAGLSVGLLAIAELHKPGGTDFAAGQISVGGRQLIGSASVVLLLAGTTVGLTSLLARDNAGSALTGDRDAFDLRSRLVRPLDITESATPLARVKAGLVDAGDESVFVVTVVGLRDDESIELLTVAVLDRYDGRIWSTSATFEPAGSVLPVPSQAPPTGSIVDQTVVLTNDYSFRFLPQAGVVRTVTAGDLAWDPRSGVMANVDETERTFETTVAIPAAAGTPTTSPAPGTSPFDLSDDQRAAMNAYLADVISADDPIATQLESIEASLASDDFGYNIEAPAGHSLAALVSYLSPEALDAPSGTPAARIGFAEHSAAAFAVLARQLGAPSRVVVGYQLDTPLTAEIQERVVTENMIHAWPEVWLEGQGWVRFEPTNKLNQTTDQASRTPSVSSAGVDANRTDLPDLEEPILRAEAPLVPGRSRWWLLTVVLAAPVLYGLIVIGAKRVRRARRQRQSADRRVLGAWRETQDRFMELGLPSSPAQSAGSIAIELDRIDLRDVAEPVAQLGPFIDTALYAQHPISDDEATNAWMMAATAVAAARSTASLGTRVRARLDPRTLSRR